MSDEATKNFHAIGVLYIMYMPITIRLWGKSAGIAAGYSFMLIACTIRL